jgi:vacuolar-type H+-ATPase subunit D/Vma8
MSDYTTKYPQPVRLSDSAYDSECPRSIQDDIDYIEAQQKRIFYLDNRVERLEQLLRNQIHYSKTSQELIRYLETQVDTYEKRINELDKEVIKLDFENKEIPKLKTHIQGLETEIDIRNKAKKAYLKKAKKNK